jgi:hypothetical protein
VVTAGLGLGRASEGELALWEAACQGHGPSMSRPSSRKQAETDALPKVKRSRAETAGPHDPSRQPIGTRGRRACLVCIDGRES